MEFKNLIYLTWTFMINNCLAALPSDIPLCKSSDVACISNVTTNLLKSNPNGRPDFGLIKLDPYTVKNMAIKPTGDGPVTLELNFYDLAIKGLSTLIIERSVGFTKDPKTSKFEMYGNIPVLEIKGKYKIGGRILVLPIQGEGNSQIELKNVKTSVKFKPITSVKNGKTYLAVEKLKCLLEPKGMKLKFENLFNGDKELGKQMNIFLNENWKDVWTEVEPAVNDAVTDIIKAIMAPLFKMHAYEDIFVDTI